MKAAPAAELETVAVEVPESAVPAYEAALAAACAVVGFFQDEARGVWRVEGVKAPGEKEAELALALALAAAASSITARLVRGRTPTGGWLARTSAAFPEQRIGRRFAIRGTHLAPARIPGRIVLALDAGVAFGSGEHGSTRGCLRALERIPRRPHRILDLGTGSGVLAMAASALFHRPIRATDIDPWSVRVTRQNAAANRLGPRIHVRRADGWRDRVLTRESPYDLVLANILARPLCAMARDLAHHLAPGGTAILAGLLARQARMVLAAHRRQGLVLQYTLAEGEWTTLVLRRRHGPLTDAADGRR